MTKNRVNIKQYDGQKMYLGAGMGQYCWGCAAHRQPGGGSPLGRLRLWHCAACVQAKAEAKAAKMAGQARPITAGNGTTEESENGNGE